MRRAFYPGTIIVSCLYLLVVFTVCSESPIKEEGNNMSGQAKSTGTPARVVLEDVPQIGWGVGTAIGSVTTFPMSLWSCMKFLGEDYSVDYIFCTSGAAFRLLWKPNWYVDNIGVEWTEDRREFYRYAFEAVGYAYDFIIKEEDRDNEAYFRSRIIESIRDMSHPVIAQGVVGPPEWCIITGYDEHGDVLIGWSYFGEDEFEPSGYFRKRDWFKDTHSLTIIGEKQEKPPLDEIYHKTLELALKIVRTPVVRDRHGGLAAYKAWADALLCEEEFPAGDVSVALQHLNSHDENMNVVGEGRWCAWQFMKQMAKDEPAIAEELLAAASCYEAEYNLMGQGWKLTEGFAPFSEAQAKKFAEPDVRQQIANLITQARDEDEEAANHIELALAKIEPKDIYHLKTKLAEKGDIKVVGIGSVFAALPNGEFSVDTKETMSVLYSRLYECKIKNVVDIDVNIGLEVYPSWPSFISVMPIKYHMASYEVTEFSDVPKDLEALVIPASKYAVVSCESPINPQTNQPFRSVNYGFLWERGGSNWRDASGKIIIDGKEVKEKGYILEWFYFWHDKVPGIKEYAGFPLHKYELWIAIE